MVYPSTLVTPLHKVLFRCLLRSERSIHRAVNIRDSDWLCTAMVLLFSRQGAGRDVRPARREDYTPPIIKCCKHYCCVEVDEVVNGWFFPAIIS